MKYSIFFGDEEASCVVFFEGFDEMFVVDE